MLKPLAVDATDSILTGNFLGHLGKQNGVFIDERHEFVNVTTRAECKRTRFAIGTGNAPPKWQLVIDGALVHPKHLR